VRRRRLLPRAAAHGSLRGRPAGGKLLRHVKPAVR
jgi:hypothetical protein